MRLIGLLRRCSTGENYCPGVFIASGRNDPFGVGDPALEGLG
jgi:hypothetical protein